MVTERGERVGSATASRTRAGRAPSRTRPAARAASPSLGDRAVPDAVAGRVSAVSSSKPPHRAREDIRAVASHMVTAGFGGPGTAGPRPAPARDGRVLEHLGARLRVVEREARTPLDVGDERRPEVRIVGEAGVVGR